MAFTANHAVAIHNNPFNTPLGQQVDNFIKLAIHEQFGEHELPEIAKDILGDFPPNTYGVSYSEILKRIKEYNKIAPKYEYDDSGRRIG
jgi:hypothetical protein